MFLSVMGVSSGCGRGDRPQVVTHSDVPVWVPDTADGLVPVIVTDSARADGGLIRSSARRSLGTGSRVHHYDHVRVSVAEVTPAEFARLQGEFGPERVERQRYYEPTLSESLPLIGNSDFFTTADASVFNGSEKLIAILDTPLGNIDSGRFGNCQGGPGTANCKIAEINAECGDQDPDNNIVDGHGINVSGIATSIAVGAKVLFFDIFTTGTNTASNLTQNGFIVCALNAVAARREAGAPIVSANLSLGSIGGGFLTTCSTSATATAMRALVDDYGVMPVVAAGNGGNPDGISDPGCVPWATTVGATYDKNFTTDDIASFDYGSCSDTAPISVDQVPCFSNVHGELDIFAPGMPITAAGFTLGGTSQATPHVSGAAARMASLLGTGYSPRRAATYLRANGTQIEPTGRGTVWDTTLFPRLDLAVDSPVNAFSVSRSVSLLDTNAGFVGLDIPDAGSAVTSTITIPANACIGNAASVLVDPDILHPARGELTVTLSHGSSSAELSSGISGSDIRFGIHQQFISTGFSSESCSGNWTLSVQDTVSGNSGALTEWTILITDSVASGNEHGAVTSFDLTSGTLTVHYDKIADAAVVASMNALYLRPRTAAGDPLIRLTEAADNNLSAATTSETIAGSVSGVSAGVYDVIVRLDDRQDISEPQDLSDSGELDNDLTATDPLVITRTGGADFITYGATLTSSVALSGSMTVSGTYDGANIGDTSSDLQADFCFIGIGIKSGTEVCRNLPQDAGALGSRQTKPATAFSFTLPAQVSTGLWFLEVRVASNPVNDEIDTTNNTYRLPVVLGYPMPDLVPERLKTGDPNPDQTLPFNYQYRNSGTATAPAHSIQIVASFDAIIGNGDDQILGSASMPALVAGSSQSGSIDIDPVITGLPDGKTLVYLGLVVDSDNEVTESNETNNFVRGGAVFNHDSQLVNSSDGGGGCQIAGNPAAPLALFLIVVAFGTILRFRRDGLKLRL